MGAIGTSSTATARPAFDFVWRFAVVAAIPMTLYYYPYGPGVAERLLQTYLSVYAHLAGTVLSLLDKTVRVAGTHIDGRMRLVFALNCDAMDVFILFSAAVLAFPPATWRSRMTGIACAFFGVVLVNILRIVTLYFIGIHFPLSFDFFHLQIWPFGIVAMATFGFLYWARAARARAPSPTDENALAGKA